MARYGFSYDVPKDYGEVAPDKSLLFDLQQYCENISSSEAVELSILSTYSLNLSHTLSQCSSLLNHGDLVIFHGMEKAKHESDEDWPAAIRAHSGRHSVRLCFVAPSTHRYNANPFSATDPSFEQYSSLGVHHPKYVIIFTATKLHIAISTANLVNDASMNIVWTDSFPRVTGKIYDGSGVCDNDFGVVLEDFIVQVIHASASIIRTMLIHIAVPAMLSDPIEPAGREWMLW